MLERGFWFCRPAAAQAGREMNDPERRRLVPPLLARGVCLLAILSLCACSAEVRPVDYSESKTAHVARDEVAIRAELAPASEILATARMGDRLEILERRRGSVRVRSAEDVEGWTGASALVTAETKRRMDRLKERYAGLTSQGKVHALDVLNVHLDPERESETIYQLEEDEAAELLARRLTIDGERQEGWSLIRLATGHAGWVLETRVYSGIPVEVAQYAEGRRIVAYFALGEIADASLGENKTTWLWTQSPGRNSDVDFDRIRVFRWNTRAQAYHTVKLETGLRGYLPVTVRPSSGDASAQFDVIVEKDGEFFKRSYELTGARVNLIEETPTERVVVELEEPRPVIEETKPPSMLERLLPWWR